MEDNCNSTIKETFQEPRKKFWLRSRKRTKSDAISISSMDISIESEVGKKKKRRRITEVASNIFSSANTSNNKFGSTLHRSFNAQRNSVDLSFLEDDSDTSTVKKKRKNSIGRINNFSIRSWVLDVANTSNGDALNNTLGQREIKRQEAIYELYCGENVLLADLCILRDSYYEPLLSTDIFSSEELFTLFGDFACFIKIHTNLRDELFNLRDSFGCTESIGSTILNWLSKLTEPYIERCRTQIWARNLLQEKKTTNKRFQTFLKRRLETPHSLDFWTYLDTPRSRIVKYPLLFKEILRYTPTEHIDQISLKEAIDKLKELLKRLDKTMGDAECKLAQSKIIVKVEYDCSKCIENATDLITEGQLKDARGMKFYCFLFDSCFVITRPTRHLSKKYNLSFPVIPKEKICVSSDEKNHTNFGFKIGDYFMITVDEHGKRHWIDSFNKVINLTQLEDNSEKENKPNAVLVTSNSSTRNSTSSMSENSFPFSLKKNLLKQTRNSFSYVK